MMSSVAARWLGGLGQQLDNRWFVGDQRAHLVRVPRHERQPGHRAAAGAEDVGAAAHRVDDRRDVIGPQLGCGVLGGVDDGAVGKAAGVVGDDGVGAGNGVRQRRGSRQRASASR